MTSAAAVPILVERGLHPNDARVAAVGPGTARALRDAGITVDLVPSGESTARRWSTSSRPRRERPRVLFPRGDLAAPTLADGLRARGWQVDDVVAYRTVSAHAPSAEIREAWVDGTIRGALLTSASTVRELNTQLGPPPTSTLLVGIGPTTAAEAARLGLPLAGVATEQTMTGLVDALAKAANTAMPEQIPSPEELP